MWSSTQPTRKPSPYQTAILDWIETGSGNAIVSAVAGSGKTSTLIMAARKLPRGARSIFLAFNNSIVKELKTRLEGTGMQPRTIHAVGMSTVKAALGEARENAPVGTVETISEKDLIKNVSEGDLILCRLTAPLVAMCLQMIANHVAARVKGKDIGKMLTSLVEKVAELRGFEFDKLAEFLDLYVKRQCELLARVEGNEAQIESLLDRADCIKICLANYEARDVADFCAQIESLFADERASVTLSTVHRAKGLEEKRVFIIKPDKLPLVWAKQQDWERQQELNLKYVALTRALDSLTFVVEDVVAAAQATLFDSPALAAAEPQAQTAAAQPVAAVAVGQAPPSSPAAQLSALADQLAALFNEADELISRNKMRVPVFDQNWGDSLGDALFKLRNIARANGEEEWQAEKVVA